MLLLRPDGSLKNGLLALCGFLPRHTIMAEIGCYTGESTEIFLESGKVDLVYCVDPWTNGYDPSDLCSKDASEAEKVFDWRMSKWKRGWKKNEPLPNNLGFIYIDANHQYEAVKADIEKYRPLCKIIGGHDYGMPGVTRAVDEAFGKPSIIFEDSSWLIL